MGIFKVDQRLIGVFKMSKIMLDYSYISQNDTAPQPKCKFFLKIGRWLRGGICNWEVAVVHTGVPAEVFKFTVTRCVFDRSGTFGDGVVAVQ